MPDELRTRIAAVLYHRWWESSMSLNEPPRWNQLSDSARDRWLLDADALIRELGWREHSAMPGWFWLGKPDEQPVEDKKLCWCGEPSIGWGTCEKHWDEVGVDTTWVAPGAIAKMMGKADE